MRKWMCAVAVAGLLAGAGCVSSSSDAQRKVSEQKRTYLLEADVSAVTAREARFGEAKLRSFRGLAPFGSANVVVRRASGETVLDFYNAWVAAPHELARVQVARYLERAGLFRAVHDAASGTLAPLGIEGSVCELCLDCRGEVPTAVVTLRLVLLDERTTAFTVLGSAEGSGRVEYDAAREDGIPRAFNAALTMALDALARELAELDVPDLAK